MYERAIGRLAHASREAIAALTASHRPGLVTAARKSAEALNLLGDEASAPLVLPAHARLDALARAFGGAAKPTGAGGGDLAWLIAGAPEDDDALAKDAADAGFYVEWLTVEPCGVRVRSPVNNRLRPNVDEPPAQPPT